MIKRCGDIFLSLIGIILSAPIMLISAILIQFDSPGPVIFKQTRVGKDSKDFEIFKFRTMVEDAESLGSVITTQKDPRITQVGALLRWLKFDELPQFFNVLKGDMSIVGPRPEVPSIVKLYSKKDREVLSVKPGIFGTSQITNRDETAMLIETEDVEGFYLKEILPKKIENDLGYVQDNNPFKDLKIFFGSLFALFLTSIKFRYIFESRRRIIFLVFDIAVSLFVYWIAFVLRFEGNIPESELKHLRGILPFIILVRAPAYIYFGLYQTLWQYLGIQELISVIKAATFGSVLLPFIPFFNKSIGFPPRTVVFIDWMLLILALGGSRIIYKLASEHLKRPKVGIQKNVLIVGAEDTGELLVREYIKRPSLGYKPIGFIDDDPTKQSVRIHGVKVMGKVSQIPQIIKVKKADEVIIALPEASGEQIKAITRTCKSLNLVCRIVPHESTLISPQALPLKLRPVNVSDLLGRQLVDVNLEEIQAFMKGKKILVTGAGGSIGSELSRVIYQNHPHEIILVDNSESCLYDIETDLKAIPSSSQMFCYLADVTDEPSMRKMMEKHKPDIVFHAAAYKHVPIVEKNFQMGILNNVLGTQTMAKLACEFNVSRFVLISTDKAINPTSIMGATKRISELYIQSLKSQTTQFMAVRFGNVFNSHGSVVPLFQKQIEQGGPITITDENVTRYFMDVSEAVFLIVEASILGKKNEIFVLNMGKAVRILDLAQNLLQLSGLDKDAIPIKFTGLRPGEKLEEEIEFDQEDLQETKHKKIRIWKPSESITSISDDQIQKLIDMVSDKAPRENVLELIKALVPEYQPWQNPL